MGNLSLSISAKKETATRLNISARHFNFIADEPESFGGTDQGPNPLEYLLGGYAACLNVVAHIVAKEQNIQFDSLEILITGNDLDPAKFQGQETSSRTGFQSIDVQFNVDTNLEQEALDKWIAAVKERCPAGDNLANATPISLSINQTVSAN